METYMPSGEDIDRIQEAFKSVQDKICDYVSKESGVKYKEVLWPYEKGSGGGRSRIWETDRRGASLPGSDSFLLKPESHPLPLIEKGACNFSGISGKDLPESAVSAMKLPPNQPYVATGVSLIFHSSNAYVPTIHMNIRFFKCGERWWFGGGVDVTPNYPILDQVLEFHTKLKQFCDRHQRDYSQLKERCDEYFFLPHRNETRGVGGLFWDAINDDFDKCFSFTVELGNLFPSLYNIFLHHNKFLRFTEAQRQFVLYRRGRYVEFNLLFDRGTKFGVMSKGRTESIMVSLPSTVHWIADYHPPANTPESYLYDHFLQPQDWLALTTTDKENMEPAEEWEFASSRAAEIQTEPVSSFEEMNSSSPDSIVADCPLADTFSNVFVGAALVGVLYVIHKLHK